MKLKSVFMYFIITLLPNISLANLDAIKWQGTYYNAIPNKKGVSPEYCKEHTPGTFIHIVKDALAHPIKTNRNITLDRASFHVQKVHGIYLMHGDLWASGKTKNVKWQDHIHYYVYKLTEAGLTRGIWSTTECKGLYIGRAISGKS